MAYNVVFVIYQVVIVLLLFMPNVNCQVWSDLKHFFKAWLDLLGDKLSYENQIWKAISVDCCEVTCCPFWLLALLWALQMQLKLCSIVYAKAFDHVDHNKLWKILKEMGIPDHLICLLRNQMQVRKQRLELDMEQQTGSK